MRLAREARQVRISGTCKPGMQRRPKGAGIWRRDTGTGPPWPLVTKPTDGVNPFPLIQQRLAPPDPLAEGNPDRPVPVGPVE